MLLTATQSFCILHIIKHAVHTFFVFGKECKDEFVLCILRLLWLFCFWEVDIVKE